MSTLSKEFIAETKKEIQRLEGFVKTYEARIETLQELLRDNAGQDPVSKSPSRKKTPKSREIEPEDSENENVGNA